MAASELAFALIVTVTEVLIPETREPFVAERVSQFALIAAAQLNDPVPMFVNVYV